MNKCENCGNEYGTAFQVTMAGKEHTLDSFECAINILAPQCAHCAKAKGVHGLRDHAD